MRKSFNGLGKRLVSVRAAMGTLIGTTRLRSPWIILALVAVAIVIMLVLSGPGLRALLTSPMTDAALYGVIGLGLLALFWLLWVIPKWQVQAWKGEIAPADAPRLENDFRQTAAQIIGGLAVLVGLYFTRQQITDTKANSDRSLEIAQRGQITDRFTRAIDQIGSERDTKEPRIETRLGGIYSLHEIARDTESYRPVVAEIFTTYVRENAVATIGVRPVDAEPFVDLSSCKPPQPVNSSLGKSPRADIRAIIAVLAGDSQTWPDAERMNQRIWNLDGTDLKGLALIGNDVNLRYLSLYNADLANVDLRQAHLEHADLNGAYLEGAYLMDTHLEDAHLDGAHLRGAFLNNAHLDRAHLNQTDLRCTDLIGAQLGTAVGLTREQVKGAFTGADTILPENVK